VKGEGGVRRFQKLTGRRGRVAVARIESEKGVINPKLLETSEPGGLK